MKRLILAGGGGTRLWPLSRKQWPKQFLPLVQDASLEQHSEIAQGTSLSLLTQSILRASHSREEAIRETYIITGQALYKQVLDDLKTANLQPLQPNVLVEPMRRNTAPAIALAALHLAETSPLGLDEVIAILPSDQTIDNPVQFIRHLEKAEALAKEGFIVTLGVHPTEPHTGYGYIEVAPTAGETGQPRVSAEWLPVRRFVEKPDAPTARHYFESGLYYWNAGIFILSLRTLFDNLKAHSPAIHQHLQQGYTAAFQSFEQMPDISFDYAVMEHASKVAVIPMETYWSDVGSWDSLYDILPKTESGNAVRCDHLEEPELINSQNCLLWSENKRPVALVGMENCLVVDTPDALLIVKKGESQQVRTVVDALERAKHSSLIQPFAHSADWGTLTHMNLQEVAKDKARPVTRLAIRPDTLVELSAEAPCMAHAVMGSFQLESAQTEVQDGASAGGSEVTATSESLFSLSLTDRSIRLKSGPEGCTLLAVGSKVRVQSASAKAALVQDLLESPSLETASLEKLFSSVSS